MAVTILPQMTINQKAVQILEILDESGLDHEHQLKVIDNARTRLKLVTIK